MQSAPFEIRKDGQRIKLKFHVAAPKVIATWHENDNVNNFCRFSSTPNNHSRPNAPSAGAKALEITLHDGLDRLEDFALMMAFKSNDIPFEILAITPPVDAQQPTATDPATNTHSKVVNIQTALLKKMA